MRKYFLLSLAVVSFFILSLQSSGQDSVAKIPAKEVKALLVHNWQATHIIINGVEDVPDAGRKLFMNFTSQTFSIGDGKEWYTLAWSYDSLKSVIKAVDKEENEISYFKIEKITSTELILSDRMEGYLTTTYLKRVK